MRTSVLLAAATGALTTYFMDPYRGRRRRAIARDKLYGSLSGLDETGRVVAVDLRNRVQGTLAAVRQRGAREDVPDDVLAERVRACLGRVVSHPGSIEVRAMQGTVTLQGPVLEPELNRMLRAVSRVRGVNDVVNRLQAHAQPGNIPGLQGGTVRHEQRINFLQENWSPATRAIAGGGGAIMALYSLARRTPGALLLGAAGIALLVRAGTRRDAKQLHFTRTIHIPAPVDKVFAFWSNFENFPKFMRNVRAVRKTGENRWRWEVAGPLGATVQWDATITEHVPNERLAWSTTAGAQVQHAGIVRFQPEGGGTRVQIQMSYNPPAGALGHAVASLFGVDPRRQMDADLMRLKGYFETGKAARDAARAPA